MKEKKSPVYHAFPTAHQHCPDSAHDLNGLVGPQGSDCHQSIQNAKNVPAAKKKR